MLDITFLGTSAGMPTVERGMPAISFKYGPELLLFDCGEGTQRQMMKFGVGYGSVSAIFVSHPHLDHYLGMYGYLETLRLAKFDKKLKVFLPFDFREKERYGFAEFEHVHEGVLYETKDFVVSAFRVEHVEESYGFVFKEKDRRKFDEEKAHALGIKGLMFREIEEKGSIVINNREISIDEVSWIKKGLKVVYTGDCFSDDQVVDAARGADLLIHEATFDDSRVDEAIERKHSTARMAGESASKAGVKKLILTHVSPRYGKDVDVLLEECRKVFKDCEIAYDGMKISL